MKTVITLLFLFVTSVNAQWVQTSASHDLYGFAELNNEIYAATALGILVSADDGASWSKAVQEHYSPVFALGSSDDDVFVAVNNGILLKSKGWSYVRIKDSTTVLSLAADKDNIFAGTYSRGVWFSSDGGSTWIKRSAGVPDNLKVTALAVMGNFVFAGTFGLGMYVSSDLGVTWHQSNSGIYESGMDGYAITGIVISGHRIIISTFGAGGIFVSSDAGEHWEVSNAGVFDQFVNSIKLIDGNIIAGTSGTILLSTNNGTGWVDITGQSNIPGAKVSMINGYALAGGSNSGIWRCPIYDYDFTSGWQHMNGPSSHDFIRSIILTNNYIFAASTDKGIFRSADDGISWSQVNNGISDSVFYCLAMKDNRIFAGPINDKIYFTENHGDKWDSLNIPMNDQWGYIVSISIIDSDIYLGAGEGAYKSTNNGTTWQKLYLIQGDEYMFTVYKFLKYNGKIAAITRVGMLLSSNGGNTWQETTGFGYFYPDDAVVLDSMLIVSSYVEGVHCTTDEGYSWSPLNNGLNAKVLKILYKNNMLFAGTENGVYASADTGKSWDYIGLNNAYVTSLAADDNYIYAGTYEHGIWKRGMNNLPVKVDDLNVDQNNYTYELCQNYPNPFNPTTTIRYSVPEGAGMITLKVYSILGKELATLVNDEKPAGSYEADFDGSSFSSGVYFYRLQSRDYSVVKKFILMK